MPKLEYKNGRAYLNILGGDLFIVYWKQNIPRNSLKGKYKTFWVRIPVALWDYWSKGRKTYLLVFNGITFVVRICILFLLILLFIK